MFPENAEFICRKCITRFFFKPEEFWQIEEGGAMGCPNCRITSDKPGVVSRFFKFYLHNFLWDMLSPIQLDPADYPVQYPIYKESKG